MQTFLPNPQSFSANAAVLDRKRLNSQINEGLVLLKANNGLTKRDAWANHPAARMWKQHNKELAAYTAIMFLKMYADDVPVYLRVSDLITGDFADNTRYIVLRDLITGIDSTLWHNTCKIVQADYTGVQLHNNAYCNLPWWWGNPWVHMSHRHQLYIKNSEYYWQFAVTKENALEYHWPVDRNVLYTTKPSKRLQYTDNALSSPDNDYVTSIDYRGVAWYKWE